MIDTTALLRYIRDLVNERGYPPNRREVAEFLGHTSKSSGQRAIQHLVDEGLVETFPFPVQGARITAAGMSAINEDPT